MCTVLSDSEPRARKSYNCDASDWILNEGDFDRYTFSEKRDLVKAMRNKWRIQPGEIYSKQVNIWCGEFNVHRAIPALHAICVKYDMYQE